MQIIDFEQQKDERYEQNNRETKEKRTGPIDYA